MNTKSKAFKGLVFILLAAVVVAGVLLLVKTYGPSSSNQAIESNLPEGTNMEDLDSSDMKEFSIDENGKVSEVDPENK